MRDPDYPNLTKHEQILAYIEQLAVGTKISVRTLAKQGDVSEGTAYRAIKDAEIQGLVNTKERIGTVRIEQHPRNMVDSLSFSDVLKMVDGEVQGGEKGLDKTLNKFVIGAMQQEAMLQYVDAGSLLIVGNRYSAHRWALEQGAAVLVTGGFDTTSDVKQLADELSLPIMSSRYDTFTVASMINRAMYDQIIKRKILLVEDLLTEEQDIYTLQTTSTVSRWRELFKQTGHSRFPVVDDRERVVGILTSRDVVGADADQTIDKLMTKQPNSVQLHTSIASAAHMLVWEGIELLPVVDHYRKLIGVISRKDVLKAMQYLEKQPQIAETFEDLIWSEFREQRDEDGNLSFVGKITPQMTNRLGSVSEGVLMTIVHCAAYRAIQDMKKGDLVLENSSTYYICPVQIESSIEIRPRMIELSRKFGKIDVEVYHDGQLACKVLLTAQVIQQL